MSDVIDEYHSEEYYRQFWETTKAFLNDTLEADAEYIWDESKQDFVKVK